ncbi:putative riboflavin kinase protein [Phaeoacremonium minimum UCRPA7]|uniref:Riboflavin kinase n=1 Tax=Phaeoacremonium minimum (strain UCR-PA7) TaxID=1286976 RepID=R8BR29_PHAM7|nr:putative riboflavin kinase protein [Phaeoacremonium minimum UCRPA7]EOO01802.1 putative riboflavin kinase protein [Phaeoacremonium minimum UCRPA7]
MADTERPLIVGADAGPEAPFPLRMEGKVISGFGRGSKELGIPTANLPVDSGITPWIADIKSGVYFGWAALSLPATHPDHTKGAGAGSDAPETSVSLFPMVMSIGYNPFYQNTVRSAEVHVLHAFGADFYDVEMRLLILGYIRDERSYPSLEALIKDINFDCDVGRRSLERDAWKPKELGGSLDGSWLTR